MEEKNTQDQNSDQSQENLNENLNANDQPFEKANPKAIEEDPTKIHIDTNIGEIASGSFDFIKSILSLRHTGYNYQKVISETKENVVFQGYNVWILICSIVVASIGLNMDSVAVVIGAMLISPLMGPIRGIGFGVGINDFPLLISSFKNFGVMIGVSLVTSVIYFLISPIDIANSQLLGRTEPNFLDALIAFSGGLAGVIAATNGKNDTVISGVAIATALMPPLCTAGWGIANGEWRYFAGASYLFLLNSLFIALSTIVLLRYLKFPQREYVSKKVERKVQNYIIIFLILVLTPSGYLFYKMTKRSTFEENVGLFVNEVVRKTEEGLFVTESTQFDFDNSQIELAISNTFVDSSVIEMWNRQKENYDLEKTKIKIIQGEDFKSFMDKKIDAALGSASNNNELAKLLTEKEMIINKFQREINQYKVDQEKMKDPLEIDYILKGFKEEYQEIDNIAINRSFIFNAENQLDTNYVIAVNFDQDVSLDQQQEVKQRLCRRFCFELNEKLNLNLDTVHVINF